MTRHYGADIAVTEYTQAAATQPDAERALPPPRLHPRHLLGR